MNRKRRLGVCVVGVAVIAAVTIPAWAIARRTITISGSTSVAPLTSVLAKGYLKQYPKRVKFRLAQGGSDVGVADVAAGRVTIGASSRDPRSSDPGGLVFYRVAKDALCIVTHPSNPVGNLTQSQIRSIFSGSVRNWENVPGAKVTGPINLVVRTAASGTQDAFQRIYMGSSNVSSTASAKASNGLQQQTVKTDPNAIAYVSLDFVAGTHPVPYAGVACNLANAKSGQYGGVRNFYYVTRGRATGAAWRFINWAQNSARAQKIVGTHWVPIK